MHSTCTLKARCAHAIVDINIVIGVVLGEVLVAHVVPLVVDVVIGLALRLSAHVVIVVFVVAMLHSVFCMGNILFTPLVGDSKLRWRLPN